MSDRARTPQRQQGTALVVSLILLLATTLVAVTAARTTGLQERMAGNLRNRTVAFEAAETTLRVAEQWIEDRVGGARPVAVAPTSCSAKPCNVLIQNALDPLESSTWTGNDVRDGPAIAKTAADPEYFIEQQQVVQDALNVGQSGDQSARIYYRTSARAVGGNETAVSILRSIYAARF